MPIEAAVLRQLLQRYDGTRDPNRSVYPCLGEIAGETWSMATTGHAILAFPGDVLGPDHLPPASFAPTAAHLTKYLAEYPEVLVRMNLDVLRRWCNDELRQCESCWGNGRVDCTCTCGHDHDRECEACGGTGFKDVVGVLIGVGVRRDRLRVLLAHVPYVLGHEVCVGVRNVALPTLGLIFVGQGWRGLLTGTDIPKGAPEFKAEPIEESPHA